jgi:hypothetical protein
MISGHGSIDAAYGVCLGKKTIVNDTVAGLSFAEFSRRMRTGGIL